MDTALALGYQPPAVAWSREVAQQEHIVWWVVFVGFAYLLALAYSAYCTYTGGHPDIELTWKGFKVTCRS